MTNPHLPQEWSWLGRAVFFALAALGMLTAFTRAAEKDDWKFDVLHLKNGRSYQGLVDWETPTEIHFQWVRRKPGVPTFVFSTTFERAEVEGIDKLDPPDREVLLGRLKALDPTGKHASTRMKNLVLKPSPWIKEGVPEALSYHSEHFVLLSDAREDLVRLAADRLDQVYGAYARFLPPRLPDGKPTTILLVRSVDEYHAWLREQGQDILNPAFFDESCNRIACASDLERLGDDLARAGKEDQQALRDLEDQKAEWARLYKGRTPASLLKQNRDERERIVQAERANADKLPLATRQLFRILYHEAFHAYLANFVYPPDKAEVPLWLNEGLAQIFETAIVEAGELRVGHADVDRLARLKDGKAFLPLEELLKAGPKQFLVAHGSDQQISDNHYLNSWALAFYLTFDRRLLGTAALDRYVLALKNGADPVAAFRNLVGEPLPDFEKDFHQYVVYLKPDGSSGR